MVCHGNLATRAEEVKTEIAVIFLHLRISTLPSPCSPPPKHTFWFLQVVVHWIKSFVYFNDLVFDNFYLWRIKGITHWLWNFRASVDTSLIKTLSLLCITQVLPMQHNFPSECKTYIDNEQFLYRSIASEGHSLFPWQVHSATKWQLPQSGWQVCSSPEGHRDRAFLWYRSSRSRKF